MKETELQVISNAMIDTLTVEKSKSIAKFPPLENKFWFKEHSILHDSKSTGSEMPEFKPAPTTITIKPLSTQRSVEI